MGLQTAHSRAMKTLPKTRHAPSIPHHAQSLGYWPQQGRFTRSMRLYKPQPALRWGQSPSRGRAMNFANAMDVPEAPGTTAGEISAAVLQLHRGSRDWPAHQFDRRAFELLLPLLRFDAGLWGSVRADAPAHTPVGLHGLFVTGLEPEALAACLAGLYPPEGLLVTQVEPLAGRRVEIRLWRHPGRPAFSDSDQQRLVFLMPHLVEAQRENRLSHALDNDNPTQTRRSLALCDHTGVLQQADEQSLALLRTEWPRWTGSQLPENLAKHLDKLHQTKLQTGPETGPPHPCSVASASSDPGPETTPASTYFGRNVTVRILCSGLGLLLDVRRRSDADRLSTRQRDIAQLYAQGLTCPQIAQQLGLTASTVNNHLGVVFKKLAVRNKVQLLQAMRHDAAGSARAGA
jgi:DNA-binding CsgD family transcriptional regulator